MKLERNETTGSVTFSTETREITLTCEEAYFIYYNLKSIYFSDFLADTIESVIDTEEIDISKYNGTIEEFIEEIKSDLESRTNYDVESATEEQINDAVIDTADYYGLFN